MRSLFPGYFTPTEEEKNEIERGATLVLDANVLLNLYRFSDDAREGFLSLLRQYSEKIWLPHQVAFEFLENRLKIIIDQAKLLEDFKTKIKESLNSLESPKSHPFVKNETLVKLRAAISNVCEEIDEGRSHMDNRLSSDDLLEQVAELTKGRVGPCFTEKELLQIFSEGEERYKQKVPPGYRDEGKGGDQTLSSQRRRFGDYIIWREVINHATEYGVDIIFVTADEKDDWWTKHSGRKFGPRPELIDEFSKETSRRLLMYTAQRFLEKFGSSTKEVIQEVGQLSRQPNDNSNVDLPPSDTRMNKQAVDADVEKMIEDVARLRFKSVMVKREIDKVSEALQILKLSNPENYDLVHAGENKLKLLRSRYEDLNRSLRIIDSLSE